MTQSANSPRRETLAAIDAVEKAVAVARHGLGVASATAKEGRDLVTATDIAIEDAIRSQLTGALGLPLVGEERGGERPLDGSPYWLVDPICGTRNFASGIPLYCVNIALVEGDQVTLAVVGDPARKEIHAAERGRGAWTIQGGARRALRTSDESCIVVVEDGKSTGDMREQAAQFMAAAIRADRWDLRSLGTTLALPYVAAGRIAAYVLFHASAIHTVAGSLLVAEAGGALSDAAGRPWSVTSDSVVASANADLHQQLRDLVSEASA